MPKRTIVSLSQDAYTPAAGYQQTKKRRMVKARKTGYLGSLTSGIARPFPERTVAKLIYCESVQVADAIQPMRNYFFSCNNIYDPNNTGGGHQPYGHDTYGTIYNHYTVVKSKITFMIAQNTAVLQSMTFGGTITDDASGSLGFDNWLERPGVKSKQLQHNAGPGMMPLTLYWDRAKRFPRDDTTYSLSAPMGASPAEQEYFEIDWQTASSGLATGLVYVNVKIEYTVEFYELKDLGGS